TGRRQALAALERGAVENSYLGGMPAGVTRIEVDETARVPTSGDVIVLGLPEEEHRANDRRYPIAILGSGFRGLLRSDSTRIPGLVSIADIAPTALGQDGALTSETSEDAAAEALSLDARIGGHRDARLPSSLVAAAVALALTFFFRRGGVYAFAAGLLVNLALGIAAVADPWAATLALGLGTALGALGLAAVARSTTALGVLLVVVLAAYLAAMAVDPTTVALSPWGPGQVGRFYGVTNLLETMLLVPALAGAAYLWPRFGPIGLGLVAALAFATIAGNRFGADGGGALVLGVAYAVLVVELAGGGRRRLLVALGSAAAAVLILTGLDAAIGGSSHVTRAVDDGPGELVEDLRRRLEISWNVATSSWYAALVVATALAALALLTVRLVRGNASRESRALPLALAAGLLASLFVNDAPHDVAVVGLIGYLAVSVGTLAPDAPLCPPGSALLRARVRPRRSRMRR
ncbi:MAG TPA: hypothetical protein VK285_05180, partial [Gaiellaceae bacterium]|nr:hypothetical protein [Gaiellaceae bacterium]